MTLAYLKVFRKKNSNGNLDLQLLEVDLTAYEASAELQRRTYLNTYITNLYSGYTIIEAALIRTIKT